MWPGQWGISYPEARAAVAKPGEGGRWARGSLCTGGFCNDWFPATCEFGSGIQASNKGPDLIRNPMPVALDCWGRGGPSVPPKGMPGNACTQPRWPTRYCLALGVLEALEFGYSSEIELEVSLLPAGQFARVSNIRCLRGQGDEVGPREMFFLPSEKEGDLKMPGNLSCPEL